MINKQEKIVLADLLQRESVSDIVQTMLTLAGRESVRLQDNLVDGAPQGLLKRQFSAALEEAEVRVKILRVLTQTAAAQEVQMGVPFAAVAAAGATQMSIL